jgi:putative colanic acid biosynthesis glycosyltransferase
MNNLSIVTVVRNDFEALLLTQQSIVDQRNKGAKIEWIIIDGSSTDMTINYFSRESNTNVDIFLSEKDNGIYDAMNKGIKLANGYALLFLNAGDYFVGDVLNNINPSNVPCFIEVKFTNYFGKLKTRKIVNERLGISNCHQGIIFKNTVKVLYDLNYAICADYKYFLDHGYTSKLKVLNVGGYVYWNQGISLKKWKERDRDIFAIRKLHFGLFTAFIYEFPHFVKRILRTIIFRQ